MIKPGATITETKYSFAAVMVVYNQNPLTCATYTSLIKVSGLPILIYDNSPNAQNLTLPEHVFYQHDSRNLGVSNAYNEGFNYFKKQGFTHVLVLDSDSNFPPGALELYKAALVDYSTQLIFPKMISNKRVISPFYFRYGKTWYGEGIEKGKLTLQPILAINSGLLIPIQLAEAVGNYNVNIPLDFSDIDFVLRCARVQPKAYCLNVVVQHGLSEHEQKPLESAKFRYKTYLVGLKYTAINSSITKILMWYWAKLKALKLSFKYRSTYFFSHYIKTFLNVG
ncbi:MAG: glycosyltransferase [Luteibaculaceae bacterium]